MFVNERAINIDAPPRAWPPCWRVTRHARDRREANYPRVALYRNRNSNRNRSRGRIASRANGVFIMRLYEMTRIRACVAHTHATEFAAFSTATSAMRNYMHTLFASPPFPLFLAFLHVDARSRRMEKVSPTSYRSHSHAGFSLSFPLSLSLSLARMFGERDRSPLLTNGRNVLRHVVSNVGCFRAHAAERKLSICIANVNRLRRDICTYQEFMVAYVVTATRDFRRV